MAGADITLELRAKIEAAVAARRPMVIEGAGSKNFLGYPLDASFEVELISTLGHHGIVDYAPEELMLRVRSGTPLSDVVSLLARHGQQLPFEPPAFAGRATMGGIVAAGLAGPGRVYHGAVRDLVLGAAMITGAAEHLEFGGQVMKNVAGYDVSRLLAGSFGTLGLILDISFKVLPLPEVTHTLVFEESIEAARSRFIAVSRTTLPVTASAWFDGRSYLRVAGSEAGARQAREKLGGETTDVDIWVQLRDHTLGPLQSATRLWRVSVPPGSDDLLAQTTVLEWHGGQRWLCDPGIDPRLHLKDGHATLFRTEECDHTPRFQPLSEVVERLQQRLTATFDPAGLFNRHRLYRRP